MKPDTNTSPWRDDQGAHPLAGGLGRGPAEEPLRGGVPAHDHAVSVERDKRVRRGVEHHARARLGLLELLGAVAQPVEQP
jgi:hypothetical protein